jgi:hypothetical protein
MNFNASKIVVLFAIVIVIAGGLWFFSSKRQNIGINSSADFIENKPIDQIITTFAYMPFIDYKFGTLKREFFKSEENKKEIVKGICYKEYEVGIGYDNIGNLMKQYMMPACNGEYKKMPEPEILSLAPTTTRCEGKYDTEECYNWNKADDGNERPVKQRLLAQLDKDKLWYGKNGSNGIVQKSQMALVDFMKIYCKQGE